VRLFYTFVAFLIAGVCLGAEPNTASTSKDKEPVCRGKTLGQWMNLLNDKDEEIRWEAVAALGEMGHEAKPAVPALIELLKNQDRRKVAAWALGKIGPAAKTAVPTLTTLLKDKRIRSEAATALGEIGPSARSAVPALIELFGDADQNVRATALASVRQMIPPPKIMVPALIKLLGDEESRFLNDNEYESGIRAEAISALREIGPEAKEAVPVLVRLLLDRNARSEALWALASIGPYAKTAVPILIKLLDDEDNRQNVVIALGSIGPEAKDAVPALIEVLKDHKNNRVAAWALWKIGPAAKAAVPALTELLKDENVQWEAVRALGRIGPEAKTAVPSLVELLKIKDSLDPENIAWTLGQIGPAAGAAVPALTQLIEQKDSQDRTMVFLALGAMGPEAKNAIPVLTKVLKDRSETDADRQMAGWALGEIDPKAAPSIPAPARELKEQNKLVSEGDAKKIKKLIAELAEITDCEIGLCPTMDGFAFAPVESMKPFKKTLRAQPRLTRNAALASLVELGPAALPFLLESLDDETPTHLIMGDKSIWFHHEIDSNLLNAHEMKVLGIMNAPYLSSIWNEEQPGMARQYTVKISDVCFVAIGQITNREYMAVRGDPYICTFVNSPVQDPKLAAEVRAIWGKSDHRKKLFDSLSLDLRTRVPSLGRRSGDFRPGAAMRLAYYFPDSGEDLILAQLNDLVQASGDASQRDPYDERGDANFVAAVVWSKRPKLRAKILEIFSTTKAPKILLAAMPATEKQHDELVFRRIMELLDAMHGNGRVPEGDRYNLLVALGHRFPDRAEGVLRDFMKSGTVERRWTVIRVLSSLGAAYEKTTVSLLGPLLEDKRDSVHGYWPVEGGPRYPIRVCDKAAETIAACSKTLKFNLKSTPQDRDRQIEAIRRAIAKPAESPRGESGNAEN
jgi:HEAT repeat protein